MLLTVARLSSHTYTVGEDISFVKKSVETAEGIRVRFYAYEQGKAVPYGIIENSRFYTMSQTEAMTQELARSMPDIINVKVVEVESLFGHVKVRYEA